MNDDHNFNLFWGAFGMGLLAALAICAIIYFVRPYPEFIDRDNLVVKYKGKIYTLVEKEK